MGRVMGRETLRKTEKQTESGGNSRIKQTTMQRERSSAVGETL